MTRGLMVLKSVVICYNRVRRVLKVKNGVKETYRTIVTFCALSGSRVICGCVEEVLVAVDELLGSSS